MSAQAWSAIAQFTAAAVALGIVTVPAVARWIRRPQLTVEIGEAEPYVTPSGRDALHSDQVRLRVMVRNTGKRIARGLRGTVDGWWVAERTGPHAWLTEQVDPAPLPWASQAALADGARTHSVDIPPGSHDLLEVAWNDRPSGDHRLALIGGTPYSSDQRSPFGMAMHRVTVSIWGENTETARYTIEYQFSPDRWVEYVRSAGEPPADEAAPAGLIGKLRSPDPPPG